MRINLIICFCLLIGVTGLGIKYENKNQIYSYYNILNKRKDIIYSYENTKAKNVSLFRKIVFGKIQIPKYVLYTPNLKIVLDSNLNIIKNSEEIDTKNLIIIDSDINLSLDLIFQNIAILKNFNLKMVELTNENQWIITFLYNDNIKIIKFPVGNINLKLFQKINEKYDILNNFDAIEIVNEKIILEI